MSTRSKGKSGFHYLVPDGNVIVLATIAGVFGSVVAAFHTGLHGTAAAHADAAARDVHVVDAAARHDADAAAVGAVVPDDLPCVRQNMLNQIRNQAVTSTTHLYLLNFTYITPTYGSKRKTEFLYSHCELP